MEIKPKVLAYAWKKCGPTRTLGGLNLWLVRPTNQAKTGVSEKDCISRKRKTARTQEKATGKNREHHLAKKKKWKGIVKEQGDRRSV